MEGDWVLVARRVIQDEQDGYVDAGCSEGVVPTDGVHRHPGVSVANLHNEIDDLWEIIEHHRLDVRGETVVGFRAAREEAARPKWNQEVIVKGLISKPDGMVKFRTAGGDNDYCFCPHPDDIATRDK